MIQNQYNYIAGQQQMQIIDTTMASGTAAAGSKTIPFVIGEQLLRPAIDCCCRTADRVVRCAQNILHQDFLENEDCRLDETILCFERTTYSDSDEAAILDLEMQITKMHFECEEIRSALPSLPEFIVSVDELPEPEARAYISRVLKMQEGIDACDALMKRLITALESFF